MNTRTSRNLRAASIASVALALHATVAAQTDGPVRLARFASVSSGVTWRPNDRADWSSASPNVPLRQGGQIWVEAGGRAEVQFDDGSVLRLGSGAVATLQTMFSDDKGEFTEVVLDRGLAYLRAKSGLSEYQIDTPEASVKAFGPVRVRIGADDGLQVVVRGGEARVEGDGGKTTLRRDDELDLRSPGDDYRVVDAGREDAWDGYNERRDDAMDHPSAYLPQNIGLVAGDLDAYGDWHVDPRYGHVWVPRGVDSGWRPYREGHWVWVEPFGWTWVAQESWGWAPYHYGTWVAEPYGWGWVPGPEQQYWSPAVVHFTQYNDQVVWAPLAPREVHYPAALSVGFGHGNWAVNFSIGGAACYYPATSTYCEARPWSNGVVNRTTNVYNVTRITNVYNTTIVRNAAPQERGFVPQNARLGGGATFAARADFGHVARFQPLATNGVDAFRKGRSVSVATGGGTPLGGPIGVRPTPESFTPTHAFVRPARSAPAILQRPIVRAGLRPEIARQSVPMARALPSHGSTSADATRMPPLTRRPGTASTTDASPARSTQSASRQDHAQADRYDRPGSRSGRGSDAPVRDARTTAQSRTPSQSDPGQRNLADRTNGRSRVPDAPSPRGSDHSGARKDDRASPANPSGHGHDVPPRSDGRKQSDRRGDADRTKSAPNSKQDKHGDKPRDSHDHDHDRKGNDKNGG